MTAHTRAAASTANRDGRGIQTRNVDGDRSAQAEAAPRRWRIAIEYTGDESYADEAALFVCGMVAATYGPCDTNTVNDCTVIEALGVEALAAQHVDRWQAIAAAVLPRLLMDDGTVTLKVSDAGYIR
jgi:hypothetical protein